jgi:hypothetical protein
MNSFLNKNMMKASEANIKAKTYLSTVVPKEQYHTIMTSINYLTTQGEFNLWEEWLHEDVIARLRNEGYTVKKLWNGGYNISWKNCS